MIPPRFMFDDLMDFVMPPAMIPQPGPIAFNGPASTSNGAASDQSVKVRQVFPESWLWSQIQSTT